MDFFKKDSINNIMIGINEIPEYERDFFMFTIVCHYGIRKSYEDFINDREGRVFKHVRSFDREELLDYFLGSHNQWEYKNSRFGHMIFPYIKISNKNLGQFQLRNCFSDKFPLLPIKYLSYDLSKKDVEHMKNYQLIDRNNDLSIGDLIYKHDYYIVGVERNEK